MSKDNELIEIDDSIIRDFRKSKLRWGWNMTDWKKIDDKTAIVKGIGRLPGIGKGEKIANGDIMLFTLEDVDGAFKVIDIKYDRNPNDSFTATVKSMGTVEEE
jgi:hypothetical protein